MSVPTMRELYNRKDGVSTKYMSGERQIFVDFNRLLKPFIKVWVKGEYRTFPFTFWGYDRAIKMYRGDTNDIGDGEK